MEGGNISLPKLDRGVVTAWGHSVRTLGVACKGENLSNGEKPGGGDLSRSAKGFSLCPGVMLLPHPENPVVPDLPDDPVLADCPRLILASLAGEDKSLPTTVDETFVMGYRGVGRSISLGGAGGDLEGKGTGDEMTALGVITRSATTDAGLSFWAAAMRSSILGLL